ncbi:putative immunity protein [Devosia sp.]|uniref:putative immunity protein n=1 Tax=Devosia sp. TaxID=1871048 RepID=UPI001B2670EF|nr:hypothetical protein [Devosia sp.]MBO9587661.1 hypothetical protein [Devosia sp.]
MIERPGLGNSAHAEPLLRRAALWAADCADLALPVFEAIAPADNRARDAIDGARQFGLGGKRDKGLRTLAWAAHAAASESDAPSAKYAARSAMLAAAVAYTHTDLTIGKQGINQARHLLGPAVYAALACEASSDTKAGIAENILQTTASSAPVDVFTLLRQFPLQPRGATRLGQLFHDLDSRLRQAFGG